MSAPVARLQGVSKRFGTATALETVSLAIHPGECLALVGHNGSGKSTLIKTLLGLVRPQAGTVEVFGRSPDTHGAARLRARIGFLPENVAFDGSMTGYQTLRFFARLKGLDARAAEPLLDRVGLADVAGRRLYGYSKGLRQRLGLAQALLGSPDLLLLDEPTTGLDPELRRRFYDIVFEAKARGSAVLISSHVLSELEAQTDRIVLLARGRLLAQGTLDELRAVADLPLSITLKTRSCATERVAAMLPRHCEITHGTANRLEIRCRESAKMSVLRAAAVSDDVLDISDRPVGLEALYAHFAERAQT